MNPAKQICWGALCCFLVFFAARAGELQLSSGCEGHKRPRTTACAPPPGFTGTFTDQGATVHFESCRVPGGVRAKVWKPDGSPILEVLDEEGEQAIWIGGKVFSPANTKEQRLAMVSTLTSREGAITPSIVTALVNMGFDLSAAPVMTLARGTLIFEE